MQYAVIVKIHCNGITQDDLDNWSEYGGITLEEYVRFIMSEQSLFDIMDNTKEIELIAVDPPNNANQADGTSPAPRTN